MSKTSRSVPSRSVPSRSRKVSKTSPQPARTALVLDTPVVDELRSSFMSYALSVIVSRALPDARDGLKPVHRRILFSLYSQNIKPSGPYKKSARVVGDTMARYHPHGDSAIYESLVRLAQDFSMRVPLVDPHGNFGSLDDSPAASRYTECRLAEAGLSMLDLLDEDTVDFVENYDGTEKEPSVLPAAFPNLLVNGSTGVAVGMATNIPPHNLAEVAAAAAFLLRNKKASIADLLRFVPGPDFPSGGEILDKSVLRDLYMTGRGMFTLRAKAQIVELSPRKKGIEVTELPYTVGPEKVIARIRELIGDKKLSGIADARDFSDRTTGLRLLIEVKNGFDPAAVLSDLYRLTPMQETFAASFVALLNGRPRVCSLYDLLKCYVDHKLQVLRRSTSFRLARAAARAHLLEGLVAALDAIDEVVALIKSSKDTESARARLMKLLSLDLVQANYVLDMPLRRLTSLEVSKVKEELASLRKEMKALERLLGSEKLLAESAASSIESAASRFSTPRRTALDPTFVSLASQGSSGQTVQDHLGIASPVLAALTKSGSLGLLLDPLGRARPTPHDISLLAASGTRDQELYLVSASGSLAVSTMGSLSPLPRGSKGLSAASQADPDSHLVGLLTAPSGLLLATKNGVVKRLDGTAVRQGQIITLDPGDELVAARACSSGEEWVLLVTRLGQVLRFQASQIRPQQRPASGVAGISLADSDSLIAAFVLPDADLDRVLWVATSSGALKGTAVSEFPVKGRATGGLRACRFLAGETHLVAAELSPTLPFSAAHAPLEFPKVTRRDSSATKPGSPAAYFGALRP